MPVTEFWRIRPPLYPHGNSDSEPPRSRDMQLRIMKEVTAKIGHSVVLYHRRSLSQFDSCRWRKKKKKKKRAFAAAITRFAATIFFPEL